MNSVYFGIFLGIIIGVAGEHILIYILKTLKERKEREIREAEERLDKWYDKKIGRPKLKGEE